MPVYPPSPDFSDADWSLRSDGTPDPRLQTCFRRDVAPGPATKAVVFYDVEFAHAIPGLKVRALYEI